MAKSTPPNRFNQPPPRSLEQILEQRQLSRNEHLHLTSLLLANHRLTAEDRRQINRIFDQIQLGQIQLVDKGNLLL